LGGDLSLRGFGSHEDGYPTGAPSGGPPVGRFDWSDVAAVGCRSQRVVACVLGAVRAAHCCWWPDRAVHRPGRVLFCVLRARSNSLLAPLLLHWAVNGFGDLLLL
jgi:hypothetical protein